MQQEKKPARGNNMYISPTVKQELRTFCSNMNLVQGQWASHLLSYAIYTVQEKGIGVMQEFMEKQRDKTSGKVTQLPTKSGPPEHDPYDLGISKEDAERAANMFKRT